VRALETADDPASNWATDTKRPVWGFRPKPGSPVKSEVDLNKGLTKAKSLYFNNIYSICSNADSIFSNIYSLLKAKIRSIPDDIEGLMTLLSKKSTSRLWQGMGPNHADTISFASFKGGIAASGLRPLPGDVLLQKVFNHLGPTHIDYFLIWKVFNHLGPTHIDYFLIWKVFNHLGPTPVSKGSSTLRLSYAKFAKGMEGTCTKLSSPKGANPDPNPDPNWKVPRCRPRRVDGMVSTPQVVTITMNNLQPSRTDGRKNFGPLEGPANSRHAFLQISMPVHMHAIVALYQWCAQYPRKL